MNRYVFSLVAALLWTASASHAAAETCFVSGNLQIQSQDRYYCDNVSQPGLDCTGWTETNLRTTTKNFRFARIEIWNGATFVAGGMTDQNGDYAVQFTRASCSGLQMSIEVIFARKLLPTASADYYFRLVGADEVSRWGFQVAARTFGVAPCSSNSCLASHTFLRTNNGLQDRLANVYYTMNSAFTEAVSWHNTIEQRLSSSSFATNGTGILRVKYADGANATQVEDAQWILRVGAGVWTDGATMRHEAGHVVHLLAHNRAQDLWFPTINPCLNYAFPAATPDGNFIHSAESCEYGFPATLEGLGTFFGVRSIATGNGTNGLAKNAWYCACPGGAQDECTRIAATAVPAGDRADWCFQGIGDNYARTTSHCVVLQRNQGCNCASPDNSCPAAFNEDNGYRNETQTARYMWDMIDSNDEGGDDTNESANSVLDLMINLPCGTNNHDCNEPSQSPCRPEAYNNYDISLMIPGDQGDEREINCVIDAAD